MIAALPKGKTQLVAYYAQDKYKIWGDFGVCTKCCQKSQRGDRLEMPVKFIEREAIRCKNLMQDLLIFSRAGKMVKESLDLKGTIESLFH